MRNVSISHATTVLVLVAVLPGCASMGLGYAEPRGWSYVPSRPAETSSPVGTSITILPFDDERPQDNRNSILYAFIPGMFYADMKYSRPEARVPHLISGTEWAFNPAEDFRGAVARELEASRVFESIQLKDNADSEEFVLKGTIYETQYTGRVYTYFISLGGPLLAWWILPEGMVAGTLAIAFSLEDAQTGTRVWRQAYEEKNEGDLFWIYGKPSDFQFPELFRRVMEKAVPDIRSAVVAARRSAPEVGQVPEQPPDEQ
jgi:hypothetical protein